ncbi:MAG TPA: SLC13 family permease [Candidatus Koribacter sp.]|jgi:Na+/H+ antiporter NhaD/arsenite permease-like protein
MFVEPVHIAAWIIFIVSYGVFAIGRLPGTRVDRAAMAFIGAVAMFAAGALDGRTAVAALNYETLVLLFSMMVLVAVLHLEGFFEWITGRIVERLKPTQLLPGIIFSAGVLSAFLVNDVVCLFMAPLILKITRRMGRNPLPFLLALATASNIGSAATITGNPQNILISSVSHIAYRDFFLHLGPVSLVGLFLDWVMISLLCRKHLAEQVPPDPDGSSEHRVDGLLAPLLITIGIIAGFLAGFNPALVAACGAAVLMLFRSRLLRNIYGEIDWSLLILFIGLFLIIGAAQHTGIADTLLRTAERLNLHNLAIFSVAVTLLSNIASNVPAVMLLKDLVPQFPNTHQFWLALAMSSTLAGNLTITGSIANIIVVETVRPHVRITFKDYLVVGVPTTIVTIAVGVAWLAWFAH